VAREAAGARGRSGGTRRRELTSDALTSGAPTRIFVYGTLLPGHDAWPVLEPWVRGVPQADAVAGCLYDTGRGYPAATFPDSGDADVSVVHGVVVALDPLRTDAALVALDRYEGSEYRRVPVRTEAGTECETYTWIATLEGCRPVPGGRFGI
jgi:gamma-glutamylcyclotransferase (GGCT)/AIG2-like uncharacterized protein YtfP